MSSSKEQAALIRASGLFDEGWYLDQYPDVASVGLDPLEHYLFIGAELGRSPGPNFDAKAYISALGDELKMGENPLLHALSGGGASQSLEVEFVPLDEPFEAVDVLVNCWLRNPESLHGGLVELMHRLEVDGIRALLVTHAEVLLDNPEVETRFATFMLSRFDMYAHVEPVGRFPDWLKEVVEVELRRLGESDGTEAFDARRKVDRCVRQAYRYWRSWLERACPRLMIVWGSTSPLSRLQIRLCGQLDIPYLVMERGHFSRTLSIELLGQFAHGGANLQPHLAMGFEPQVDQVVSTEELVRWVRSCEEVPYGDWNKKLDTVGPVQRARKESRRVLLFIGVNELGSGIGYREGDTAERHSLVYGSTREALARFRDALSVVDPEALLVFKPHPADRNTYESNVSERFLVCDDANINELIIEADLCVSLSTTALARCVVEDKPILLLSLSELSMKGVAYEVSHPSELAAMLSAAICRDGFERRRARGLAFLRFLFAQQLVGLDEQVPTRLSIASLAGYIGSRLQAFVAPESRRVSGVALGLRSGEHPLAALSNKGVRDMRARATAARETEERPVEAESGEGSTSGKYSLVGDCVAASALRRGVDVVVPIYGNASMTSDCIEQLLKTRSNLEFRLILIDDFSPGSEMTALLGQYEGVEGVIVLRNHRNLGFPGTANRGLCYGLDRDVVLVNSDAVVPAHWLRRLQDAAYCRSDIASATPMSNNAGVFSFAYPELVGFSGDVETVEEWNVWAGRSEPAAVEVPAGHGFCLYVRRSALSRVGVLDQLSFDRGYYEEIDWCWRAARLGFRHVCATHVVVGHIGGSSFGDSAPALRDRNRELFRSRFPDYFPARRDFIRRGALDPYRFGQSPASTQ
ncbi:MAG: glycosyltransferase [Lysobacteraceae bacterium]